MACTHVRLGILETSLCVYVCVVVEGIYNCKNKNFGNNTLCLFPIVVDGMCTCKTRHFGYNTLCLCLCCIRKFIHM